MYSDFFHGKRVTLMGLGLLGRGVGDAAFIADCGAQLLVTDMKSEEQLAASVAVLKRYASIAFRLGEHIEKDFTDTEMVIKAAGVPIDSPYIAAARAVNVPVYMSTALAAKFAAEAGATIVGVTGTRGKTTVAEMVHRALKAAGKRSQLGGNVRGISTLSLLPTITSDSILVLELDSWQLQGFGDLRTSPDIALFTNLMPDHQNYYPDMASYFSDKANIFKYQVAGDSLFVGGTVLERVQSETPPVAPLVPPPITFDLRVPGEHNRELAALAAAALRALGLTEKEIQTGLTSFEGVEGRLQFVREVDGVRIYNDNNATTPEATIAALRALDEGKKNIILILGGSDKGLDMKPLWQEILVRCKDLYFLAGSGVERVRDDAPHVPVFASLQEVVATAMRDAAAGDVLLFSPAFASFGMFKNEYDRNDQFMRIVSNL